MLIVDLARSSDQVSSQRLKSAAQLSMFCRPKRKSPV